MNEALKKFSEELAKELIAAVSTKENKEIIDKTLASEDSGTFEVIISTEDVDRSGETLIQAGMDNSNFKNNPIVLYGHDYYSLPIGVCDSLELVDNKWVAKGRFAPADANPFAQQVRKLYDLKILRTTSVGLIVKETDGKKITKWELLEFSFVPVPANPYALSQRQVSEMAIDTTMLKAKGLDLEVKEEKKTEIEEKGALRDYIEADGNWGEKWDNLDEVSMIIDVFYRIYLDKRTPVGDFNALLIELAELLTEYASAETVENKEIVVEKISAFKAKTIDVTEYVAKSGKRLSAQSIEVLTKICDEHKNLNASLEAFIAEEAKADEAKNIPADDKLIEKRSKSVGPELLLKGLNDFLTMRDVLRGVDNAVGSALANINKSIREKSQKR